MVVLFHEFFPSFSVAFGFGGEFETKPKKTGVPYGGRSRRGQLGVAHHEVRELRPHSGSFLALNGVGRYGDPRGTTGRPTGPECPEVQDLGGAMRSSGVERVEGIEPSYSAWKANVDAFSQRLVASHNHSIPLDIYNVSGAWCHTATRPCASDFRAKSVPKIHFTDITLKNLPEGVHFDTRLTSFGLRVGKNRRTWLVVKGANRTKIALGHYPSLSLQDARRKALAALAAPEEKSPPPTFPEAREAFLAKHGPALRPRSLYQITRTLQRHFSWQRRSRSSDP